MSYKKCSLIEQKIKIVLITIVVLIFSGCDDDNKDSGAGYFQIYNASENSPEVFLIVGQDDDDDYDELILTSVDYTESSNYYDYLTDTYDIDLAWQDEDDATDLEILFETQITISDEALQFIVVAEDILTPNIIIFDIPIIDDEDDSDDDLFNLRVLNMHDLSGGVNIYSSESDETFNEAVLIGQFNYTEMSDNQKIEQDDYIFYITSADNNEILYQSNAISYQSASQYILVIRENNGSGSSPFILDLILQSATEYPDANSEAQFRVYNGLVQHELLPEYQEVFDLQIKSINNSAEINSIAYGEFSDSYLTNFGDYSLSLTMPEQDTAIIENHLLTLNANSDKSVFFYLLEEEVDEDGDGDVDEDGDGIVDEIEITVNSLVVENIRTKNIYTHQIKIVNLIDEFSSLKVYFVKHDETIETTSNSVIATYLRARSVSLRNNTYSVYVVGKEDSSDLILVSAELILSEESRDSFLILEESQNSSTGYKMTFSNQAN